MWTKQNQPNPFIQMQICFIKVYVAFSIYCFNTKGTSAYLRPSLPFYAMTKNQHLCRVIAWLPFQKHTGGRFVVNTLARHSVVRGSLAIPKFESRLGQFMN